MKHKGYVLLRNFIHDRLYHPTMGYFCNPNLQVGEMKGSIDFQNLIGYSDYIHQLKTRYPQNAWLTPSQIFKPYYGMTVGNYLNQAFKKIKDQGKTKQLRITEVGAGTGAAADGILQYFKNYQPQLYHNLKYTIIEISPDLCQRLELKFKQSHPQLIKRNNLQIRNQDIVNYSDQNHNFVLFFEVLDNMPHDRVTYDSQLKQYTQQTLAQIETNQEKLQPIKDPLIKQCLEAYIKVNNFEFQNKNYLKRLILSYSQPKPVFLPTYFLMVLKKMKQRMRDFDLVISDFHSLPSSIPGVNAPIVSLKGKSSAQKTDFSTYLINRGDADIFFPTNFNLVNSLFHSVTSKQGQIVQSHQFMKQFSISNWTNTKSNYNPLKQDFRNTSFFVSKI